MGFWVTFGDYLVPDSVETWLGEKSLEYIDLSQTQADIGAGVDRAREWAGDVAEGAKHAAADAWTIAKWAPIVGAVAIAWFIFGGRR